MPPIDLNALGLLVGGRYRNRLGDYEILALQGNQVLIQYDSGDRDYVDPVMLARIYRNMASEEARGIPAGVSTDDAVRFAWTLGAIAAEGRLEAEVPPQSWAGFASNYRDATGEMPTPNMPYVHPIAEGGQNKWGSELRIYIPVTRALDSRFFVPFEASVVSATHPDWRRINNSKLWWHLVSRLGFYVGNEQDLDRIRSRIPANLQPEFTSSAGVF